MKLPGKLCCREFFFCRVVSGGSKMSNSRRKTAAFSALAFADSMSAARALRTAAVNSFELIGTYISRPWSHRRMVSMAGSSLDLYKSGRSFPFFSLKRSSSSSSAYGAKKKKEKKNNK